jgi:hypothetical protein
VLRPRLFALDDRIGLLPSGATGKHRPRDIQCKQHFLNFLPLPHGQGSFRPTALNGLIEGWGPTEGMRPSPPVPAARRS